jgi:hypothetical protein
LAVAYPAVPAEEYGALKAGIGRKILRKDALSILYKVHLDQRYRAVFIGLFSFYPEKGN